IHGMAEEVAPLGRKTGVLPELARRKPTVCHGGIRTPHEASLLGPPFKCFSILPSPQFRWRQTVVVEQNARLATRQERQQTHESVVLAELDNHQVRRRDVVPFLTFG